MEFNLIEKQWIPVLLRDGTKTKIAPYEVTKAFSENPVVSLNAPRPDFNGALIQFLIGLVQTVAAPQSGSEWKKKLIEPPSPSELEAKLLPIRSAFELVSGKKRFMLSLEELKGSKQLPIEQLLIDGPKQNTLDLNKDHFVKRGTVNGICPSCCAMTVYAAQTNSPAGGPGFRTSLRGGGPLTTLVAGDGEFSTLWHLIWLNILNRQKFDNLCNSSKNRPSQKFPWRAKLKLEATERDIHPTQYFWSMPRRITLEQFELSGSCDLCGYENEPLVTHYRELNKGTEYKAPMKHHLSPYDAGKGKAILTQPGGVAYRHWLGFVFKERGSDKEPARIVHEHIETRHRPEWQFRLWSFGYDMANAKACCWYETTFPLYMVDGQNLQKYEDLIFSVVKAAYEVCGNMKIAIKRVLQGVPEFDPITRKTKWKYKDIKKLSGDEEKERERILYSMKEKTLFDSAEAYFWQLTESDYYQLLNRLTIALGSSSDYSDNLVEWQKVLSQTSLNLFDSQMLEGPFEALKVKNISLAREELKQINFGYKVRNILGLA
ncbi:MAG TPA: type I-E CRISPR-associated protein Cse1/CasA [Desulfuromonadales bacterium]|nr:type I-E CRISPR-associated protein Cse1/CasA [Desulfuromonadales bacterium]